MFSFTTGKVIGRHRILVIYRRPVRVTGCPRRDRGLGLDLLEVRV